MTRVSHSRDSRGPAFCKLTVNVRPGVHPQMLEEAAEDREELQSEPGSHTTHEAAGNLRKTLALCDPEE